MQSIFFFNNLLIQHFFDLRATENPQHIMEIHSIALCKHTCNHNAQWKIVVFAIIIFTLSAAFGPSAQTGLRTSFLVKVYLGSGICLYPL